MRSDSFRAIATVLLPAFVLTSVPVYPAEPTKQPSSVTPLAVPDGPAPTSEWNPFLLDGAPDTAQGPPPPLPLFAQLGTGAPSSAPLNALPPVNTPPPPPPNVTVNRTRPIVDPVPEFPEFTEAPTDAEIMRARVFGEPFVPLGGETTGEENRAFADAILSYLQNGNNENTSAFGEFLGDYPNSAWRASLLANLGAHYQRTGYYTLAGETLQEAWDLARHPSTSAGLAVALSVLSEFLDLKMRFGDVEELERILGEAHGLELHGRAVEKVGQARMAVYVLTQHHEEAIASGAVSVDNFLRAQTPGYRQHPEIAKFMAKPEGASLAEVQALASRAGLPLQMTRRPADQLDIPVPSIIHLKVGHFSAVVKQAGERFLLLDPMLGGEMWFTRAALEQEASGYFLVRPGGLPSGWSSPRADQVQNVRGKCQGAIQCEDCRLNPCTSGGSGGGGGGCGGKCMATYSFNTFLASLQISDIPVWHNPPRGPAIEFAIKYHQRDSNQPQTFTFSNLGRRWRFPWLAYLEDDPSNPNAQVSFIAGEGGREKYSGFNGTSFAPETNSRAVLVRTSTSPIRYERQLTDGSLQVFSQSDGGVSPRRVFMTEWRDAQGNAAVITLDSQLRVVSVSDALNQVTTLSYELTADPLKVTKVTDPFGRSARLEYNSDGALIRITDVIGIVSEMDYGDADFIRALTTPYGTTTFASTSPYSEQGYYYRDHWVEATDPLGGKERIEYNWKLSSLPATDPASTVPTAFINNVNLNLRNTFYWDKRATMLYPGDYTKADVMHWLWSSSNLLTVTDALHSEKKALENRVWYGQEGESVVEGASPQGRPSKVGRVLDDGASQIYRYEYESQTGNITRETDPLGRTKTYTYAANGIDLLEARQINGQNTELLQSFTYNSQHQALTSTDAAGQTTTFTYNSAGQVLTVVTPPRAGITENRTTTATYDTNGYLQSVTGPAPGATIGLTYDGYGRVRTWTNESGYTLTYDYDALDRPTKVTYPDGTYEETVYNRLDAEKERDRQGQWTHTFYDALRRSVATHDPLGQTVTQQWCGCGSLDKVVDANNNATTWDRDLQGRITKETRADGSFTQLVYENTTSRLKQHIDRKGQIVTLDYFLDDQLKQVTYTNAQNPTATVSYTYDPVYPRQATMTDGTGTTTWAYNPITTTPSLGAGRLASVDGPLSNDTVSYAYDELGRIVTRSINGISVTDSFDALGRLSNETDPLGSFSYSYVGVTQRLASVGFPNGQTTNYTYFGNVADNRLQEIKHLDPGSAIISKFNYTHDSVGSIKTWTQQAGTSTAKLYTLGYDGATQLSSAVISGPTPLPVPSRFAYAYDKAGNRTAEQLDDVVTGATYNNLDEMISTQPGGALLFRGTVNEPATVTVGSKPAQVDTSNAFQGTAPVPAGTSTVAVAATDPSGNIRTNTYQVSQSGAIKTLTYDSNGSLTNDSARTFEWDGENRLIAVNQGTLRSEFTYNGLGQRVRIVEKDNGAVTSDKRFVWCDEQLCQERDASGSTVTKAFYRHGLVDGGVSYFVTTDHLGSVREITNTAGVIQARYDYDPFGRITKVSGSYDTTFGFAGYYHHAPTGLALPLYRAYATDLSRWTSEDPAGLVDSTNRYLYVRNNPANFVDPTGQWIWVVVIAAGVIAGVLTPSTANAPGPNDPTYASDPGGGTMGGAAAGATAAAAAAAAGAGAARGGAAAAAAAAAARRAAKVCSQIRCKIEIHPPHHSFPSMGGRRCWHLSITCYLKGTKGSHKRKQIPFPWACI